MYWSAELSTKILHLIDGRDNENLHTCYCLQYPIRYVLCIHELKIEGAQQLKGHCYVSACTNIFESKAWKVHPDFFKLMCQFQNCID